MIKKYLFALLMISMFALSGCLLNAPLSGFDFYQDQPKAKPKVVAYDENMQRYMPAFSAVRADGAFKVKIVTGKKRHAVRLIGERQLVDHLIVEVSDNTLQLHMRPGYHYAHLNALQVIVETPHLYRLNYAGSADLDVSNLQTGVLDATLNTNGHVNIAGKIDLRRLKVGGTGDITISGIKSSQLTIVATGNPKVRLRGEMTIGLINYSGNGILDAEWIKGHNLVVRGTGLASVRLAGRVDLLDMQLHDSAYFNGRYLRSTKTFVKTFDNARADIQVTESQHAIAEDKSNIYTYKHPEFASSAMPTHGSVLNIENWR